MKYKLINIQTKEEHLCDKVTIDGFDFYVSDSIKGESGWNYNYGLNRLDKLTYSYLEHSSEWNFCKKVIATTNPNIDIPKVVDEVEKIFKTHFEIDENETFPITQGDKNIIEYFKEGYNKSQETHPNSNEDMIDFYRWLNKNGWEDYNDIKQGLFVNSYGVQKQDKELLKLWKEQQPKTVYYNE